MSSVQRAILRFGGLTMVSRATGFLRNMVLTAALGRAALADSYLLANTVPNILYENVVGGVATAVLLPRLVDAQKTHGPQSREAWDAAANLLWGIALVLCVLSGVGMWLAPNVIDWMTAYAGPGRDADREQAVRFLLFFIWQIPFYGINAVFMAILNSHDRFTLTAAAPILNNIIATVTIWGYSQNWWGVDGLALGTTLGVVVMALIQWPAVLRMGLPLLPRLSLTHPIFRGLAGLGWPVFLTSVVGLVGVTLRSNLLYTEEGGTATFALCFQLMMTPYGILAVPIATVLYPRMARAVVEGDRATLGATVRSAIGATLAVVLPISVILSLLAEPIVRLLFERGAFTAADTWVTGSFLRVYGWVLIPHSLLILLSRPFFSMSDTRTPAVLQALAVFLSLGMAWGLMPALGLNAVAYGALGGNAVACIMGIVLLKRRLGTESRWDGFRSGLIRLGLAGACSGGVVASLLIFPAPSELRLVERVTFVTTEGGLKPPLLIERLPSDKFRAVWTEVRAGPVPPMLPPGAKVQDLALVWLPKGCGPNVRMNMEPDPAQSNRGRLVLYGNPLSQGIESGDGVTTQAGLVLQVPPRIVDTQVQLMPRGDWRPQPLGGLWIPLAYVGLGSLAILLVYGAVAMGLRAEGSNWIRARISGRD